jgi:hypothetical protein
MIWSNLINITNLEKKMNMKKSLSAFFGLFLFAALSQSAFALQPSNTTNLVGTWTNVNPATGGIVKVVVTNNILGFRINTFGACSPTPCNHGSILASRFSKSVSSTVAQGLSGQYDFGFSTMLVTAQRVYDLDGGTFLEVETRTKFAAGDTRNDYTRTELFRK